MTDDGNKKYKILYADDELQALKYFKLAYQGDFPVITAHSAAEAWKVLQESPDEIGVLVADQRMPGETGLSLMQKAHTNYPQIVRILTTAYSDLESAVNAVNVGGAFAYVTKPWDMGNFQALLRRAMDYFVVRLERDRLLVETTTALLETVKGDRLLGMTSLAATAAEKLRNTVFALANFVEQADISRRMRSEERNFTSRSVFDLFQLAYDSVRRFHQHLRCAEDAAESMESLSEIAECVAGEARDGVGETKAKIKEVRVPSDLRCYANKRMLAKLIAILANRIAAMGGDNRTVSIYGEELSQEKVSLRIVSEAMGWIDESPCPAAMPAPFSDWPTRLDTDLLAAFFIANHFGGSVEALTLPPKGPGFAVELNANETVALGLDVQRERFFAAIRRAETRSEG